MEVCFVKVTPARLVFGAIDEFGEFFSRSDNIVGDFILNVLMNYKSSSNPHQLEYLKQWDRARKRIGELIKRGSPKYQAILTGLSRKGYWHLAKTYATNCGLSKQYLEEQGFVSLRTLWIGIHYPA
ncbi:MAG: hypothetical protein A4E61_00259 [Syntrophorhabdus sp. PtaB.Bin184]|nr:MAG: hypothetical protein A4E61_00259 [Syntrophorhabdus sp. PtaB.Bin184]